MNWTTEHHRLVCAARDLNDTLRLSPPIIVDGGMREIIEQLREAGSLIEARDKLLPDTITVFRDLGMSVPAGTKDGASQPKATAIEPTADRASVFPFLDDEGNWALPTMDELVEDYLSGDIAIDEVRQFPPAFRQRAVTALINFHLEAVERLTAIMIATSEEKLNNAIDKL